MWELLPRGKYPHSLAPDTRVRHGCTPLDLPGKICPQLSQSPLTHCGHANPLSMRLSQCPQLSHSKTQPPEPMTIIPAPTSHSIKRCWPWQSQPGIVRDLVSLSHHEAGHIVLFEWFGLSAGLRATVTPTGGLAYHGILPGVYPAGPPDESGEIVAAGASAFHAGLMAELIVAGIVWSGPIHYPHESDFQRANDMLRESFGNCSSAGHAFAQRTALHVLTTRWARVKEISDVLVRRGEWQNTVG